MKPIGITANKQEIYSKWIDDQHQSNYSFTLLRYGCPCASCRGGHEKMSKIPKPTIFFIPEDDTPATRLVNNEVVGS